MAYFIYNLFLYISLLILAPIAAWRLLTRPEKMAGLWQKLGFGLPAMREKTIWIHAVSVGEVMAAEPLVEELAKRSNRPIVISVTTVTGREVAEKRLAQKAKIVYFPYDFRFAVKRAVRAFKPAAFVTIDTEIWPNVIAECKRFGAAVILANGRISDRSHPKYMKLRWLMKEVLANVSLCLMQGEEDARRIVELGATKEKAIVAGNLKFDKPHEAVDERRREELRRSIGIAPDERVMFLGSVHAGEEAAIAAYLKAAKSVKGLRLVIAPRRIEDIGWIEQALSGSGYSAMRKTTMTGEAARWDKIVPVIDTFGELSKLYAVADVVFVGGSLIPHGGQNPLEPAAHGVPVIFGHNMTNFRDAAKILKDAKAAWITSSTGEISNKVCELFGDETARKSAGEAAKKAVERNRGAASRSAELIARYLK